MAIARGVLVEIVLMVLLGCVEPLQRLSLYRQRLVMVLLLVVIHLIDNRQVVGIHVIDARAVAGALVVPLLVQARRIDGLEEHPQQEFKAHHIGGVSHMHGLGISRLVGIYLLIRRILRVTVGKAHLRLHHALYLLEVMLRPPEAAPCEVNVFCCHRCFLKLCFNYEFSLKSLCKDNYNCAKFSNFAHNISIVYESI